MKHNLKTLLKSIAWTFAIVLLTDLIFWLQFGAITSHNPSALLGLCIGTFIWFKRRDWHRKHAPEREEMIRAIRESRDQGAK